MMALAVRQGFVCLPLEELTKEVAMAVASRMIPARGTAVYQMVTATLTSIPLQVLESCFPSDLKTEETGQTTQWRVTTIPALASLMTPLLQRSNFVCAGATRAWRALSQPVIRNVASLVPDLEVAHVRLASGLSRLYLNGMYAVVSEHGEVFWPKDNNRREIFFTEEVEADLKEQVLRDVRALADRGEPLAAGWWRQMGDESKALEVEWRLANPQAHRKAVRELLRPPRVPREPRAKKAPRRTRFTKETFEIDKILAEKRVSTKEKVIYLVRWLDYNPDWEPARASGTFGGPMETWEPRLLLARTQALQDWKAAAAVHESDAG